MKDILNTLEEFTKEDLVTIEEAINWESNFYKDGIEIMLKGHDLETAKVYAHKKEVLDKFWEALFHYELRR